MKLLVVINYMTNCEVLNASVYLNSSGVARVSAARDGPAPRPPTPPLNSSGVARVSAARDGPPPCPLATPPLNSSGVARVSAARGRTAPRPLATPPLNSSGVARVPRGGPPPRPLLRQCSIPVA